MKRIEKFSKNVLLVAAAALCVGVGAAQAGSRFTGNGSVQLTPLSGGAGQASGYLGMIYNRAGEEWIACQKTANNLVYCTAKNTAGTIMSCAANSAFLAGAVASISPDSRLVFRFNGRGTCTLIQVVHSSEYEDKR